MRPDLRKNLQRIVWAYLNIDIVDGKCRVLRVGMAVGSNEILRKKKRSRQSASQANVCPHR